MRRYGHTANPRGGELPQAALPGDPAMRMQHRALAELGQAVSAVAKASGLSSAQFSMIANLAGAMKTAADSGLFREIEAAHDAAFGQER